MIETDRWTVIKARNYRKVEGRREVRLLVVHVMDDPGGEKLDTAERVANFFKNQKPQPANKSPSSAHVSLDSDSIIQCVADNDVAFAAPGANGDGIQIELAGFSSQSAEQWLDAYSKSVLDRGANVAAQYCLKYDLPVWHLTNTQLADPSYRGIIGHYQASKVFKKSDHTDPGKYFPWELFMEQVSVYYAARKKRFSL